METARENHPNELSLEKLLECAVEATRASYKESGKIYSVAFVQSKSAGIVGFPAGQLSDNSLIALYVRGLFVSNDFLSLVIQAPGIGTKVTAEERHSDTSEPINPETRPDRKDCVSVIVYDSTGRKLSRVLEILPPSSEEVFADIFPATDAFQCPFDACFNRPIQENLN